MATNKHKFSTKGLLRVIWEFCSYLFVPQRRARELYSHFGERIQRMWFYGIIELSEAVELELGLKELIY